MNARTRKKRDRRRRIWMCAGFFAFVAFLCYDVIELKSIADLVSFCVTTCSRSTASVAVKGTFVTATNTPAASAQAKQEPMAFSFSAIPSSATPVPEPSTVLLLAPTLLFLTTRRKSVGTTQK
jgi:hypothetical protein